MYISYVSVDLLRHPTMTLASMKHLISLTFVVSTIFVRAEPVTPIVNLGYAMYEGAVNATSNNTEFLGMRFAAPLTGNFCHLPITYYNNIDFVAFRCILLASPLGTCNGGRRSTSLRATNVMLQRG